MKNHQKELSEKKNKKKPQDLFSSIHASTEKEYLKEKSKESIFKIIFSLKNLAIMISFVHGMYEFSALAYFYHQKTRLNLSSDALQNMDGITTALWCLKPLFGFAVEKLLRIFKKSKYFIVFCSVAKALCLFGFSYFNPGKYLFMGISTIVTALFIVESIVCDYILYLISQEIDSQGNKSNYMPYYNAFKLGGTIIATFFGGMFYNKKGPEKTFLVAMTFPFLAAFFGLFVFEKPRTPEEKKEKGNDIDAIKTLLSNSNTVIILVFAFLVTLQPDLGSYFEFYMTDHLDITPYEQTIIRTVPKFFSIAGLLLFSYVWKSLPLKRLYITMNTFLVLVHFLFLMVTTGAIFKLGISVRMAYIAYYSLLAIFSEGNSMPLFWLWCSATPPNIEATSMAMFTGLLCLSGNCSKYFGGFVIKIFKLDQNDLERANYAVMIRAGYLVIMAVMIFFMPYNKKDEKKKIEEGKKPQDYGRKTGNEEVC